MQKLTYVTLHGIPLSFQLEFPFHASTSGADYYVLHGLATLEEGSGLHAPVAVHLSQTVREALPSTEEKDALGPVINAIRKATDTKDIEFLKSDKRQPITLSSRSFNIVSGKFTFQNPSEDELVRFLKHSIYWRTKLGEQSIDIADPVEALYLTREPQQILETAKKLVDEGAIKLSGNKAVATPKLMSRAEHFEDETREALAQLNAKHAYERG